MCRSTAPNWRSTFDGLADSSRATSCSLIPSFEFALSRPCANYDSPCVRRGRSGDGRRKSSETHPRRGALVLEHLDLRTEQAEDGRKRVAVHLEQRRGRENASGRR